MPLLRTEGGDRTTPVSLIDPGIKTLPQEHRLVPIFYFNEPLLEQRKVLQIFAIPSAASPPAGASERYRH